MFFSSFTELFFMDGHGVYVWSCFFVSFVVLAFLLIQPLRKKRLLIKAIQQRAAVAKNVAETL